MLEELIHHDSSEVAGFITISQGVVTVRPDADLQPADLVNRADKALYEAKDAGRNAIRVA